MIFSLNQSGAQFSFAGVINSITINTFAVSPGPRVLSIQYTDVNGLVGIFEYNFTGRVRPREYMVHVIVIFCASYLCALLFHRSCGWF